MKIDFKVQEEQFNKLQQVKQKRNNVEVAKRLAYLKEVAQNEQNIMPAILDAVRVYATLGEICNVMRAEFGEYREAVI